MRNFGSTLKKLIARRAVAVTSVVVVCVGGVGGIAYVLTSGGSSSPNAASPPSPSESSSGSGSTTSGGTGSGASGQSGDSKPTGAESKLDALIARAVHAEIVVPQAGGGYETVDLDRGTVTSLSSNAVTLSPIDGASPVTVSITPSTREPKPTTIGQGEQVILVSSNGNALILRPDAKANSASAANGASGGTGVSTSAGQGVVS